MSDPPTPTVHASPRLIRIIILSEPQVPAGFDVLLRLEQPALPDLLEFIRSSYPMSAFFHSCRGVTRRHLSDGIKYHHHAAGNETVHVQLRCNPALVCIAANYYPLTNLLPSEIQLWSIGRE